MVKVMSTSKESLQDKIETKEGSTQTPQSDSDIDSNELRITVTSTSAPAKLKSMLDLVRPGTQFKLTQVPAHDKQVLEDESSKKDDSSKDEKPASETVDKTAVNINTEDKEPTRDSQEQVESPNKAENPKAVSKINDADPVSAQANDQPNKHVSKEGPHVRHEKELEDLVAILGPKIESHPSQVTLADARLLQSRETRAHGHVEPGNLAAKAMSLAMKNLGLNNQDSEAKTQAAQDKLEEAVTTLRPKIENRPSQVTDEDSLAAKHAPKHQDPEEQSHTAREDNLEEAIAKIRPKMETHPSQITLDDARLLQSRETRAHGQVESGDIASQAMSLARKNESRKAGEGLSSSI